MMPKLLIIGLLFGALIFGCTTYTIKDTNTRTIDDTNLYAKLTGMTYPSAALTPGDILTTDANIVCVTGYTSTVRNVSEKTKNQVYAEYGVIDHNRDTYEVDHFIPLELGGSNDINNLWPEAADPRPGFHEKDVVENYLHHRVCDDKDMNLVEAQRLILLDCYAVYLEMKK